MLREIAIDGNAHVNSDPIIVTNTPAADLALTNLAYCSHTNLHGFAVLGPKLYLAFIGVSFVLFGFMMIPFLCFVLNRELDLRIFGFDFWI